MDLLSAYDAITNLGADVQTCRNHIYFDRQHSNTQYTRGSSELLQAHSRHWR